MALHTSKITQFGLNLKTRKYGYIVLNKEIPLSKEGPQDITCVDVYGLNYIFHLCFRVVETNKATINVSGELAPSLIFTYHYKVDYYIKTPQKKMK